MSDTEKTPETSGLSLADAFGAVFNAMGAGRRNQTARWGPCPVCGLTHVPDRPVIPIDWHYADEELRTSTGKAVGRGVIGVSAPTEAPGWEGGRGGLDAL